MKILFFCGSLEAGRDGVGDYTRRLADECAARGHDCTLIALHDPHVRAVSDVTPDSVRLIRFPSLTPWPERLAAVIRHLRLIAPDWVSWQFVAYAFQERGFLPAALLQAAPELRGPRCHVMFHELWLGLETGASLRERVIGWLQRRGILCLLEQLDPDCVHTSQATYQQALQHEGCTAGVLELFGNVPVADSGTAAELSLRRWLPTPPVTQAAPLVALTFGTLHPQWPPAATAEWMMATARRLGCAPVLLAPGRTGSRASPILEEFRRQGIEVVATGELEAAEISSLLRAADFGIAPHPWALIGKSGAATAMLEHGLPVLVPRDDWSLRRGGIASASATDPLLTRLDGLDANRTDAWLTGRRAPASALPRVADRFLQSLEKLPEHSALLRR